MNSENNVCDVHVLTAHEGVFLSRADRVVVEEPLEIRLRTGDPSSDRSISITMRTPGFDAELALGFLFGEGMIERASDVARVVTEADSEGAPKNTVLVELARGVSIEWKKLERNFYTTSSCGVCGKSSLEALRVIPRIPPAKANDNGNAREFVVHANVIHGLADSLRAAQGVFDQTGGLHAAGLFSAGGELVRSREDVGRHNAVDKLIGAEFIANRIPISDSLLMVSGRASFELVQKAVMARILVMVAVGAPSNLAIELAREFSMTLIGFARQNRFNIYSAPHRVAGATGGVS